MSLTYRKKYYGFDELTGRVPNEIQLECRNLTIGSFKVVQCTWIILLQSYSFRSIVKP